MESYLGIGLLGYAAWMKAVSTGTKFAYQVYLNYRKKSTRGVSPQTVGFDFTASVLALSQMQIDSIIGGYGFVMMDPQLNIAKFLLGLFSGSFDFIILLQIFVFYPDTGRKDLRHPLIPPTDYTMNESMNMSLNMTLSPKNRDRRMKWF